MIFAAKTTASGLIVLLIAFTFDLDQPQWALLTVFIVSQAQLSGPVLAKSFYRIIGTLIGAAVALLFVALFAQERVLFLSVLALWIGVCTLGSQYARNFAAYAFVLSGYTAAIIGVPGALDANNAFYIATARVTEICLGIMVAAAVNRIVWPSSAVAALWQSMAAARQALSDHVTGLLGDDAGKSTASLVSRAIAIENQRASAIFEDRELGSRSSSLRLLNIALLRVVGAAQSLGEQLGYFRRTDQPVGVGIDDTLGAAVLALKFWQSGAIDAAGLQQKLRQTDTRRCFAELLFPTPSSDSVAPQRAAAASGLRELLAALTAYAQAYEACIAGSAPVPGHIPFTPANDPLAALWTGLRAALAVAFVGWFWILSAWPHGSTAVILTAVATARLATMGHAVPLAVAATMIFAFATVPSFLIVEVLLPLASGFPMFALIVGPMLFGCAYLMSKPNPKTMLIGYLSALLFASVGQFQNRMVYDPVGLLNTSIAAIFAAGVTLVLWAVIAPETAEAARSRFLRVARQAVSRLVAPQQPIGLAEFETRIADGLDQLQSHLRADQPADIAALQAGMRLLGAGGVLRRQEPGSAAPTGAFGNSSISDDYVGRLLKRGHAQLSANLDHLVQRDAA
jgi:uncharacterized membrane protein YccC